MSCPKGCCPDYRTHIRGVSIGGFPSQTTYNERKLELDRSAFKSMKDQGLKPARLRGAHVMARSAKDEKEIELGRPIDADTKAVMRDAGI